MLNRVYVTLAKPGQFMPLSESPAFKLMAYLLDGHSSKEADPKLVKSLFNEKANPEAYATGTFQMNGYLFDFTSFMTEYLVQTKNKGWNKVVSFSVHTIISNSVDPELITEIRPLTH